MDFSTDDNQFRYLCICGRSFSQAGGLKNHQRSCSRSKKCLTSALAKAKEVWRPQKKRRLQDLSNGSQLLHAGKNTAEESTAVAASIDFANNATLIQVHLKSDGSNMPHILLNIYYIGSVNLNTRTWKSQCGIRTPATYFRSQPGKLFFVLNI